LPSCVKAEFGNISRSEDFSPGAEKGSRSLLDGAGNLQMNRPFVVTSAALDLKPLLFSHHI
jgi:hypothetical protein